MKSAPIKSLDPRVNRLPDPESQPKPPLDEFSTFEVFVQPGPGKPFRHEGAVHAPGLEMAYVLAKETFTRRFTCSSLFVADTHDVKVFTPAEQDMPPADNNGGPITTFEIFFLPKRGKQSIQGAPLEAATAAQALAQAWQQNTASPAPYALWAIDRRAIRFTSAEEQDFWRTLPDKKFRDAAAYKGGDKLQQFLNTPR